MALKIFMLDKNILSLIKETNNLNKKTKEQIEMIQFLKRHDKTAYRFSSLSSAIEGRKKKKENEDESINTVNHETEIISSFFKNAKTDANALKGNQNYFSKTLSKYDLLHDEKKYKSILKKYYELKVEYQVKGSIPKPLQDEVSFKLLSYIESEKMSKEDPMISIVFLDIYQINDNKFKTNPCNILKLKPKKTIDENIHNIYSDLTCPKIVARLQFEGKNNIEVKLLTLDNALQSYIDIFKFKYKSKIKENTFYINKYEIEVEITSKIINDFFQDLFNKWKNFKSLREIA